LCRAKIQVYSNPMSKACPALGFEKVLFGILQVGITYRKMSANALTRHRDVQQLQKIWKKLLKVGLTEAKQETW
jgi:hypothetical protein